ncbi:MAG: ATP-binding cassette domain-containing protein [Verrucomicrobia bacterium]|nr:ATP-binding cassette domain-containing protein [Verrucomicrobiota bacterium]
MSLLVPNGLQIGYRKRVVATVKGEFAFNPAEITLLLGLNGAGKTTLMKTISGLIPPVEGKLPATRALYLSEEVDFPPNLSPREITACLARTRSERAQANRWLCTLQVEDRAYGKLSKGNRHKARLVFAQLTALSRRMPIVGLDEPFSGLDFVAREQLIRDWSDRRREAPWHLLISIHPAEIPFVPHQMIVVAQGEIRPVPVHTSWSELREMLTADPATPLACS